ncbi:unnamed protein product [Clonostachys byssicola]|uniref:Uncharacterized protein n=1 Tax=Clonostachys byssicola TaxID=160290 RepID=A0A9N9YA84_9HYPO|nr:unnamed protein product [Clonostachys byssicola]
MVSCIKGGVEYVSIAMGSKTSIYVSSDTSIKVKKSIICPKKTTLGKLIATANENSKLCTKPGCGSTVVSRKADALSAWVCNRCGDPAQMSPARTEAETMILSIIEEEDGAMKATTKRRERYFEILERDHPAECGPPGAFISHAWAAKWGALVGAASYGCSDGDRRVWVDVFAVCQWPGSPIDLDFHSVVERCGSLILAISHEVIEEADLDSRNVPIYRTAGNNFSTLLDAGVRRKLPLARSWCLVELGPAYRAQKSMIAVTGESALGKASAGKHLLKLPAVDTVEIGHWHWASNRGSSDIVKLLIDCGANIEARTADGTRPLITAALNGHDNILTQLIDEGADAKATNDLGWSIVDCAMVEGHQHVLRALQRGLT